METSPKHKSSLNNNAASWPRSKPMKDKRKWKKKFATDRGKRKSGETSRTLAPAVTTSIVLLVNRSAKGKNARIEATTRRIELLY